MLLPAGMRPRTPAVSTNTKVELLRRINSEWETVSQGITSGVSYRFTDVSSSTLYQIRVRAVDNLGNISEWSYTDEFSPPPSIADITEVN